MRREKIGMQEALRENLSFRLLFYLPALHENKVGTQGMQRRKFIFATFVFYLFALRENEIDTQECRGPTAEEKSYFFASNKVHG